MKLSTFVWKQTAAQNAPRNEPVETYGQGVRQKHTNPPSFGGCSWKAIFFQAFLAPEIC